MAENKHQLKRHVRWEHHGGKREECPKCSFVATKTQKLWPHWRMHHPNEEVLHCDMCGYVTPLEYLMEVSKKHTIRIGCALRAEFLKHLTLEDNTKIIAKKFSQP